MIPASLKEIFETQFNFQDEEIVRLYGSREEAKKSLIGIHHSLCSHVIAEAQELMDCLPWHFHKKTSVAERYATVTEMVDIFKWLLNLCHLHGVSANEFQRVFEEKTEVVKDRIRTEIFTSNDRGPCLILDLDGVVCDRDTGLVDWAEKSLGELHDSFHSMREVMTAKAYEELKWDFYRSSAFKTCRTFPGVAAAILTARRAGVPVVILSSREARKHPRLHVDTMDWLHLNRIEYDALVFSHDKDKALLGWCHDKSIFLDDEQRFRDQVSRICGAWIVPPSHVQGRGDFMLSAIKLVKEYRNALGYERGSDAEPVRESEGSATADQGDGDGGVTSGAR